MGRKEHEALIESMPKPHYHFEFQGRWFAEHGHTVRKMLRESPWKSINYIESVPDDTCIILYGKDSHPDNTIPYQPSNAVWAKLHAAKWKYTHFMICEEPMFDITHNDPDPENTCQECGEPLSKCKTWRKHNVTCGSYTG